MMLNELCQANGILIPLRKLLLGAVFLEFSCCYLAILIISEQLLKCYRSC